jgi:hypothetical protein
VPSQSRMPHIDGCGPTLCRAHQRHASGESHAERPIVGTDSGPNTDGSRMRAA